MENLANIFLIFGIFSIVVAVVRFFADFGLKTTSRNAVTLSTVSIFLLSFACFIIAFALYKIHPMTLSQNGLPRDFKEIGPYGDLIGGLMNPVLSLIGILAAGLAFYVQYQANQQVSNQFKLQQFESQYFEMIRLHKENINQMKISGYELSETKIFSIAGRKEEIKEISRTHNQKFTEGHKVFVSMAVELQCCIEFLEKFQQSWPITYDVTDLHRLAYQIFFFGSNSPIVSSQKIDDAFIKYCRDELKIVRKQHRGTFSKRNIYIGFRKRINLYIKYSPFTGHESRLGHYYRHLYSTVKFVVNNHRKGVFDYKRCREYLKILRSQMSNDEVLMLYYNYIIGFGSDWENEKFLTKYRILHNLPVNKVKYVTPPRKHFKEFITSIKGTGDPMFEWGDQES